LLIFIAKEGFEAFFDAGDTVVNMYTNRTCRVSLVVEFRCDLSATWTQPENNGPGTGPTPLAFYGITNTSCELRIVVPYAGACLPGEGISGGSVLLILFFVFVAVYLIAGITYNKLALRHTGAQLIPHYDFWASTMLYALVIFLGKKMGIFMKKF